MTHNYEHEHDPLCRSHYRRLIPAGRCTDCELIGRTRRHTLRSALVELGYMTERAGWISSPDGSHLIHASDALDVITRLLDELPDTSQNEQHPLGLPPPAPHNLAQPGSGYDPTATHNRP